MKNIKRIISSVLVLGVCLTPLTVPVMVQPPETYRASNATGTARKTQTGDRNMAASYSHFAKN
jgi:hypothetical protein